MKKIVSISSLLVFSSALDAMDSQPPTPSTSSQTNIVQEEKKQKDCMICFQELGTNGGVEALSCADVFCSACINQWMEVQPVCPCCRKTKEQLKALSRGETPEPIPNQKSGHLASITHETFPTLSTYVEELFSGVEVF